MLNCWSTVNDDDLNRVDQTSEFLQAEFCPSGADPIWSPEYFRWKLGSANPAGKGYLSIALFEGRVIATSSLVKKRLLIDGNECVGGEVQDAYSSAAVRRKGRPLILSPKDSDPESYINKSIFGRLATEIRERADAEGIAVIYGTPNKNSYPAYVKKLDFFDSPGFQIESLHRPTWKMLILKYPSLRIYGPLFRKIEGISLSLQKSLSKRCVSKSVTIDTKVPMAAELEELWIRLRPTKGFSLIRDASYWRHRYQEHPIAKYRFFGIREREHLVGVVVTKLFRAWDGKRNVSIAEWMMGDDIPFGFVLSNVICFYQNLGIEIYKLWSDKANQERAAASRNMFFSRHRVPIILADTPQARLLSKSTRPVKFYLGSTDNV